jgi:hypothetical protein
MGKAYHHLDVSEKRVGLHYSLFYAPVDSQVFETT